MGGYAAVLTQHGLPPELQPWEPDDDEGTVLDGGTVLDEETVVEVQAAPITPLDVLCATGTSYFGPPALPYVPGVQGVGVVARSRSVPPGTRVWFSTTAGIGAGDGSMAATCRVPDADLVPITEDVDASLVAALGFSAIAAWMSLTWRGGLQPGETVIVLGSGGVVGQVAVQAARILGAGRVVAACRSQAGAERARELGADDVVLLDTGDVGVLASRFRETTSGAADLVIDPLFGVPAAAAIAALGPRGRLVHLGGSASPGITLDSATLRSRSLQLLGYTNNELSADQRAAALREIVAEASLGQLTVDHEVVPLTDVAGAWARQAAGTAGRRLVLQL